METGYYKWYQNLYLAGSMLKRTLDRQGGGVDCDNQYNRVQKALASYFVYNSTSQECEMGDGSNVIIATFMTLELF